MDIYLISDLNEWKGRFVTDKDIPDKKYGPPLKLAIEFHDTITVGKTVVTPEKDFSDKDKENLEKHGLNNEFDL